MKTDLHANVSARADSWIAAGGGKAGLIYSYSISNKEGWCELYIDKGKGSEKLNKKRFDELYNYKNEIERVFGDSLDWERLDNKRAARIAKRFRGTGLVDESKWGELQDKMIDGMIKLERSLRDYIGNL